MSRVSHHDKDAVRVTMSPSEFWCETPDKEHFNQWLNEENRRWLHDRLDNWLQTVQEFKK